MYSNQIAGHEDTPANARLTEKEESD